MAERKSGAKQPVGKIVPGNQYPGVHGKVVDWAEHTFEEGGLLFIRVRFTDKTELCWRVNTAIVAERRVDRLGWPWPIHDCYLDRFCLQIDPSAKSFMIR